MVHIIFTIKNTFPFGSFGVCPFFRRTLAIGRIPVRSRARKPGTWWSVALLRPTRHWGITLNASWTGLTCKSR